MSLHLDRARVLMFELSRWDLAEKELRQELAADPNSGAAHIMLAHSLGNLDRVEHALVVAQEAIRLSPEVAYGHNVLGWLLLRSGRIREARDAAQEAIRLEPNDPDHFALLSDTQLELYLEQEALQAAEQGLRLDPRHVWCLNARAQALAKLGREKEAEATLQSALALKPMSEFTHSALGWFHWERGRVDQAVDSLEEAVRIAPNDLNNRELLLAALRQRLGEFHNGLSCLFLIPLTLISCVIGIFTKPDSVLTQAVLIMMCFGIAYLPFAAFVKASAPEAFVIRLARFWRLPFRERQMKLWRWFGSGLLPSLAGLIAWGFTQALLPSVAAFLAGVAVWTFVASRRLSNEISKKLFIIDTFMIASIGFFTWEWDHMLPQGTCSPLQLGLACIPCYILGIYGLALVRFIAGSSSAPQSSSWVG